MNAIRALLAEDHTLVRAGLQFLLEKVEGVRVIAQVADGREALRLAQELRPDIAFLDITMPGLNGLDVLERIKSTCPEVRVLMLSMHANDHYVKQALVAGADGYLLKDASVPELELAIKAVGRGERYLSSTVSQRIIADYLKSDDHDPGTDHDREKLTPRQREILQLVAEGHSMKDIAQLMNLSVKTVETHRAQLMERLDVHNVAGLVRSAIRMGLINPDK